MHYLKLTFKCSASMLLFVTSFSVAQSNAGVPSGTLLASQVFQVFGALIFIILLILAAAWVAKNLKLTGGASAQKIKALTVLPLGRKEKVVLIESCGQKILLGVTASAVNAVHVFESTEASTGRDKSVSNEVAISASFIDESATASKGSKEVSQQDQQSDAAKPSVDFSNFLKDIMSGKKSEN